VRESRWAPFEKSLWQRNYYEHIIRVPSELETIRQYIATNPLRWATDPER
jgi:REP element-mobilizing transposase RayT